MKGAVLAGGLGTRLYPLTYATNKHLLPVFDKPMVFYPIETLVRAGISDVLVVTGGPHAGNFIRVLKNGKELGLKHLEYAYQEKESGIAEALSLCEDFAEGGPLAVILGDNTTDADISSEVKHFGNGALIFLREMDHLEEVKRFGVAVFDDKNKQKLVAIEEKPKQPKSKFVQTGLYIYDNSVFKYIKSNKPSDRGELEITDVNNRYIEQGTLRWAQLHGFWSDAGTFESLYRTNRYWAERAGL